VKPWVARSPAGLVGARRRGVPQDRAGTGRSERQLRDDHRTLTEQNIGETGAASESEKPVLPIAGSQEDVDLLLAWDDPVPRLVLIEAKGYTGWSNKQLASKARRLGAVFTDDVRARVDVHIMLAGPKPSAGLDTSSWPTWMKTETRVHFLKIPDPGLQWGVRRSDPEETSNARGEQRKVWHSWRPVQRRW